MAGYLIFTMVIAGFILYGVFRIVHHTKQEQTRVLSEDIRNLEKAVREMLAMMTRAGEGQPSPASDEADSALAAGNAAAAAAVPAPAYGLETEGEPVIPEAEATVPQLPGQAPAQAAEVDEDIAALLAAEVDEDVAALLAEVLALEDERASEEEPQPLAGPSFGSRLLLSLREPGKYFAAVMNFIRGGNLWVAGGVTMLLIGFAFLAQLGIFPIEARIAAAATAGMAMVALGLRLRLRRRVYALIMQGGGIGVLYLSVFAAAKLTALLPPAMALALMTALVIPAVILAVVQNSQELALFGFAGGFMAPILLSDGSGNYIALFSFYTLLNLGILAICRYRFWRWLNSLGAFCTFSVMGYWGITSYTAPMFASTQPFLIAFVLIYIMITLWSVRQGMFSFAEPRDAIFACGIPFAAALFQWRIAIDLPHGLSISALAFGAFFILLAFGVWRLWGERVRRLAEFYLASGVVLSNLAIPLELSGNVTSTVWAVEGAVFFFFAVRIGSERMKLAALFLQAVGMAAFFWEMITVAGHTILPSGIISLAALACAYLQKREADSPKRQDERAFAKWLAQVPLESILTVGGLLWWYGGVALEAARFAEEPLVMFFLAASVSSVIWYFAEKKTGLRKLFSVAAGLPLLTAACCLLISSGDDLIAGRFLYYNFLNGWSALAWAVFIVTQAGMLCLSAARTTPVFHARWAGIAALELLFMLTSSGRGAALDLDLSPAWGDLASIFPAVAYTTALTWLLKRREQCPRFTGEHARLLGGMVPAIVFLPLAVWLFSSFCSLGDPAPLPLFVPLLNPLELEQALCIVTFALWQRAIGQAGGIRFSLPLPRLLLVLDALLFLWLHGMLFRAIAHFSGVSMGLAWEHEFFQVLLTALWGMWGMGHLIWGNRKGVRLLWVIGAGLILMDTAKLFLVDFADKDTLFRVISFFVMGGVFLLIGWLAPLPRSRKSGGEVMDGPDPQLSLPAENSETAKDDDNGQTP